MSDTDTDRAREIVEAGAYMTLATADPSGRPWATPVWFAPELAGAVGSLLWISDPNARHSANIATRPEVSVVIFDSHAPISTGVGAYFEGTAGTVDEDELAEPAATFTERSLAQGGSTFEPADFTGNSRLRVYRFRATAGWLGERDNRAPIELG